MAIPRGLLLLLTPFLVATLVGLVVLWPGESRADLAQDLGAPDDLIDAKIVELAKGPCQGTSDDAGLACTTPLVRLLEGPNEGEMIELQEQPDGPGTPRLDVGETIVLSYLAEAPAEFRYSFADRERRTPLYVLAGLFALAVLLLGRWQGLRALVALGISLAILVVFVLPAVLEGSSPLLVALIGASAIAVSTLYLSHGLNAATTVALLATLTSLGLVGALASVFVAAARFTGLAAEEATFLQIVAGQVDLRGLLLGGVVIGALGVLDDVTVTQVSAVWELRAANTDFGFAELYRSALRIGRDHIASTVNTLVLAYAGASLPLLLLFTEADQRLVDVLNGEVVAVEVVRTLVGSIGLVASVPIATALATFVVLGDRRLPTWFLRGRTARPRSEEVRSRRERRFWEG